MATTDRHTLEHQRPTNRGSPTVDLEPSNIVNVAYHAIIGLTGNVWKETEHLLEAFKGVNAAQIKPPNQPPAPPQLATVIQPRVQTPNPCVAPHRRNAQPVQRHTEYLEMHMWTPVPHPNPEQSFTSKDMLKSAVCILLLNSLNKGAKEGDRTAQLQPHTPAGLASTVMVTQ
jgi:hypothetical protein